MTSAHEGERHESASRRGVAGEMLSVIGAAADRSASRSAVKRVRRCIFEVFVCRYVRSLGC